MSDRRGSDPRSSSEGIPPKPTSDSSLERGTSLGGRGQGNPAGANPPDHLGTDRKEVGDQRSSSKHPPHVTSNDEGAEIQDDLLSPDDVAVLPANAGGSDALTSDEQTESIDDASMYDRRPERDKDRPPSERESDS